MNKSPDLRRDIVLDDFLLINFVNLSDAEKEMVRKWRNSEEISKWMYSDHTIGSEEHITFIERLKNDNRNFCWVLKHDGGEYCGIISLNEVDLRNMNAYLGIYVNPECKVAGVGQVLIDSLKRVAFDIAHLHTLKLEVMETNRRAVDFYRKSGFIEEGGLKEFVFKDDRWNDVIIMGIINKVEAGDNRA